MNKKTLVALLAVLGVAAIIVAFSIMSRVKQQQSVDSATPTDTQVVAPTESAPAATGEAMPAEGAAAPAPGAEGAAAAPAAEASAAAPAAEPAPAQPAAPAGH